MQQQQCRQPLRNWRACSGDGYFCCSASIIGAAALLLPVATERGACSRCMCMVWHSGEELLGVAYVPALSSASGV
jgi:hypothetical protein